MSKITKKFKDLRIYVYSVNWILSRIISDKFTFNYYCFINSYYIQTAVNNIRESVRVEWKQTEGDSLQAVKGNESQISVIYNVE